MEHEYLCEAQRFFSGRFQFQVTAADKAAAFVKANEYIKQCGYDSGNIIPGSAKVIRKMKPAFGGQE